MSTHYSASCRFRAFWEAGSAGESGRPSSRITSAHLMQRAWGRGTRWCSACWTQRPSTSSSFTSWWTTSWGHCAWPPALRSRRLHMMMSAAFSSTGWFILPHRNLRGTVVSIFLLFLGCLTLHNMWWTNPLHILRFVGHYIRGWYYETS